MGKKVSKKERLFNLESYAEIIVERIERLEKRLDGISSCVANAVEDIRNLEIKTDEMNSFVKSHEKDLDTIHNEINDIDEAVTIISSNAKDTEIKNSIVNYLISTDFKGSVKHKRLISRLKKEVKEALKANSFEELRREILNGDRSLDDLIDYKRILLKHEEDQKVVDYCNKEEEK